MKYQVQYKSRAKYSRWKSYPKVFYTRFNAKIFMKRRKYEAKLTGRGYQQQIFQGHLKDKPKFRIKSVRK